MCSRPWTWRLTTWCRPPSGRINTIMDSNRVMVQGNIAEFDSSDNLLANKETIFYSMAKIATFEPILNYFSI